MGERLAVSRAESPAGSGGRGEVWRAQLDLLAEAVTGAPWSSWSDGDTSMRDGSWHAQSWREQKTRHWDYPLSWPGLRDPRSLTFRLVSRL